MEKAALAQVLNHPETHLQRKHPYFQFEHNRAGQILDVQVSIFQRVRAFGKNHSSKPSRTMKVIACQQMFPGMEMMNMATRSREVCTFTSVKAAGDGCYRRSKTAQSDFEKLVILKIICTGLS